MGAIVVGCASALHARQLRAPEPSSLVFEVASIKVRTSASGASQSGPDRYNRSNTSLRDLIEDAYQLQSYAVLGGPDWIRGPVRFDVTAKALFVPTPDQMRLMVQHLIAERFALRAHKDTREMPTYVLRLARADGRLGRQLTRTLVDCAAIKAERNRKAANPSTAPALVNGQPVCSSLLRAQPSTGGMTLRYQTSGITSSELAAWIAQYVGRAVIDGTGLSGDFDLDLSFGPGEGVAAAPSESTVSIFTALQEQLGLKLESSRDPVEVLVIDQVEQLAPN